MAVLHDQTKTRAAIGAIWQWCRSWAGTGSVAELYRCGEVDIERMAKDAGMSASELRSLVRHSPDSAELLFRRMAALDLDRNEIGRTEPQVLQDLERVCTMCECRGRCAHDLARDPADPKWRQYCPNSGTLTELDRQPWASRGEW